jgi:hypothetical protein
MIGRAAATRARRFLSTCRTFLDSAFLSPSQKSADIKDKGRQPDEQNKRTAYFAKGLTGVQRE